MALRSWSAELEHPFIEPCSQPVVGELLGTRPHSCLFLELAKEDIVLEVAGHALLILVLGVRGKENNASMAPTQGKFMKAGGGRFGRCLGPANQEAWARLRSN